MPQLLEALMLIAFGLSWPASIIKSARAKTAKGKSIAFLLLIFAGYLCGIASKIWADRMTYVIVFYCLNCAMVFIDICLWLRNRRLDAARAEG
ncbi:MAG TPA: hypothetical protein PL044_00950 [Clostridiales bacterium]|nr:MAG: hypothetical protein BWY37_00770 [Firmicutes bacterium ADurb.Bin262]HOU09369.1 hypothetical protein [Clostridiales bacterium]HQH64062.1 hypothetical protein [Clostridiales bacterium]HQK72335.1 hypothetical protein [Clostridiales bacterium]